ncbi:restriction endonuclease subunit S [Bacteroides xylanisolvens]|nr:restriction endonuclease subunit S [Bacteroides xylanisolvens]
MCTFFSGGTPSSSNKDFYGEDIAFIRSGELHADRTELFITQAGFDNSSAKMVEVGDLLLAMYGATSGDISISKIKGAINQAILCIRTKQNKKFTESVWNKHVSKILRKYLQGGQGNLSADIVKGISFSFPPLKEQGKIANLMSLLDERIATQNKIIEDLKKLKSAIIEKHYSQVEKQTTCIADLGEPFSVGNLAKDDLTETGMPCVIYGELFTTYGENIFHIESHTNKTDGMILSKKGDLLFPSSTTVDAMSLIAPSVINVGGVILGGDMFGIHISPNYNAQYLSYYFNHIAKRQLAKFAKGSTIIHLHYTDIEKAKLLLPSLEEQNRMAMCLVSLDEKVAIEQKLLSSLTCQKSYLLRQMFI